MPSNVNVSFQKKKVLHDPALHNRAREPGFFTWQTDMEQEYLYLYLTMRGMADSTQSRAYRKQGGQSKRGNGPNARRHTQKWCTPQGLTKQGSQVVGAPARASQQGPSPPPSYSPTSSACMLSALRCLVSTMRASRKMKAATFRAAYTR